MDTSGHIERAIIKSLSRTRIEMHRPGEPLLEDRPAHETEPQPTGELIKQLWRLGDQRKKQARSSAVHRALSRLREKELVERVDRDEISNPPPRQSFWQLTLPGMKEADHLKKGFYEEREDLIRRYGGDWKNDSEQPKKSGRWVRSN